MEGERLLHVFLVAGGKDDVDLRIPSDQLPGELDPGKIPHLDIQERDLRMHRIGKKERLVGMLEAGYQCLRRGFSDLPHHSFQRDKFIVDDHDLHNITVPFFVNKNSMPLATCSRRARLPQATSSSRASAHPARRAFSLYRKSGGISYKEKNRKHPVPCPKKDHGDGYGRGAAKVFGYKSACEDRRCFAFGIMLSTPVFAANRDPSPWSVNIITVCPAQNPYCSVAEKTQSVLSSLLFILP